MKNDKLIRYLEQSIHIFTRDINSLEELTLDKSSKYFELLKRIKLSIALYETELSILKNEIHKYENF